MKNYVKIARPDHWIKNLFILPGVAIAFLIIGRQSMGGVLLRLVIGFFATCLIASANYVINEWLDAEFDKYHPTKKFRPVVSENLKFGIVMAEYAVLAVAGLALSLLINKSFFFTELWLLVMGVLYNVKPVRTKDIPYFDVLSESVNNMIRLLLGWFTVTSSALPPGSILIGYWMGGAFLMGIKRFAEYGGGGALPQIVCRLYGAHAVVFQHVLRVLFHVLHGDLSDQVPYGIRACHAVPVSVVCVLPVHCL